MLQFYFLSVLMNAVAGYILFFGSPDGVLDFRCGFSVKAETFRLVVGILSAIAGLFKLLSWVRGDLPLIGDIVPAATGFLCGFILIFEYYSTRSASTDLGQETENGNKNIGFLVANKKLIGGAAMIAAVLHFLLPSVLLL